jgi:hypothetical protein
MPLRMLSFSASSARTLSVAIAWNEEIGLIIYAQCSGAHCLEFCWMLLKKISLTRGRDAMVPAEFFVWRKCYGKNKAGNVFVTGSFCEGRPLDDQQLVLVFSCRLMCVTAVVRRVLWFRLHELLYVHL